MHVKMSELRVVQIIHGGINCFEVTTLVLDAVNHYNTNKPVSIHPICRQNFLFIIS